MQSNKLQSELTIGIAKKAGVPIPKISQRPFQRQEEVETEEGECTECGEEEDEVTDEEQQEAEDAYEKNLELIEKEENSHVRDLEPRNHLVAVKKPETEVENPNKKNKDKLKGYEKISELLDTPLKIKDIKSRWKKEFGNDDDVKIIYNLNYGLTIGAIKKHPIGKRFLYGRPDMFDGDELKPEFLPTT